MARIAPFRGRRYSSNYSSLLPLLIPPPGDIVPLQEQDRYLRMHEYNFMNLIHSQTGVANRPLDAAKTFDRWCREGIMGRDPEPAIYLYQIDYSLDEQGPQLSRTGFISLLKLQDYNTGVIRPHELTFSAVKKERLEFIRSCEANLSLIFTFYDDPGQEVGQALWQAAPSRPVMEFVDLAGFSHRLWLVSDPQAHQRVARLLADKPVYIADGHHRYETCIAHRDQMRQRYPDYDEEASFNYTLIYAAALQDSGMAILPFHRLIRKRPGFDRARFLDAAAEFFEIRTPPLAPDSTAARREFQALLAAEAKTGQALGFLTSDSDCLGLLILKPGALSQLDLHPSLRDLDVVVLDEIVLRCCLGMEEGDRDDEKNFSYEASLDKAVQRVQAGEAQFCFLLNPTKVEQVKAVADAGLFMPRKSTHFYPKAASGLVVNRIIPDELVTDPLAD
ncbi:MAG: DUF1015 domain-containing protein [Deltaproteobacteria bacterium]|nr:DUF1015 domain-containing protein [Deltaproteobacteria bacterium]